MNDIHIEGLEELNAKVERVLTEAPDKMYDAVDNVSAEVIEVAKGHTPVSDIDKPDNKRLVNSWKKKKVKSDGKHFEQDIYNKAPHHHLVNDGHNQVTIDHLGKKEVVGYVPGQNYVEKTAVDAESVIGETIERFIDDAFKELL